MSAHASGKQQTFPRRPPPPAAADAARDFPETFLWGAASCPACAEGETVSDWAKLSAPDGSVPDDGPRHWRRYRYDFRTMARLGVRAYRFGCDWGRLQRGPYQPFVRDDTYRYLEMLAELRSLGIEPWLVLFQNALPRWAAAAGGWLHPETPHWFADYAKRLADVTDGEVRHWLTIHEPQVYALASCAWGVFPHGVWGRLDQVRRLLGNLLLGHRLAVRALRARLPGVQAGISLPGGCLTPRRFWHPGDWLAARVSDWILNRYGMGGFFRGGAGCDFLMIGAGGAAEASVFDTLSLSGGLSPSLPGRLRHARGGSTERRRRSVRRWLRHGRLPVYVTGSADNAAALRELLAGCTGHTGTAGPAGFFYDPLLDQFDLERGLKARNGLIEVDFHSPERHREVRGLAREYAALVRGGRLGKRSGAGECP